MKHRYFIIIFVLIIFISGVIMFLNFGKSLSNIAEIYVDGKLYKTVSLSVNEPYEIAIERNSCKNTILVEKNQISVTDANCPDKLCIKQGKISNSSSPIVCLPNRVVIKILSSTAVDTISR